MVKRFIDTLDGKVMFLSEDKVEDGDIKGNVIHVFREGDCIDSCDNWEYIDNLPFYLKLSDEKVTDDVLYKLYLAALMED